MLDIKQLVKTYDNGHQAVKGVDLSIHQGEFIVLVGPSGCGKSSILRSIAGLESITSGEIHLAGRRVDNENLPIVTSLWCSRTMRSIRI